MRLESDRMLALSLLYPAIGRGNSEKEKTEYFRRALPTLASVFPLSRVAFRRILAEIDKKLDGGSWYIKHWMGVLLRLEI
jgi:hypothetical protein